ncbi:hypothetical protein MASR2M8_04240 [Opitutaceae bacterium]
MLKLALLVLTTLAASSALAHTQGPPSRLALAHEDVAARIQAKIAAGEDTREALAEEFAEMDALFDAHTPEEAHDAGDLLVSKLAFSLELFDEPAEVALLAGRIQAEFPDVESGTAIASALGRREARARARAAQAALLGQLAPGVAFAWTNRTGLASLSDLHGSIVIIDFWATNSPQSVRAFSSIRRLAERYEGHPVAILSLTRLQGSVTGLEAAPIDTSGDPERERSLLAEYVRAKDLSWTVALAEEASAFDAFAVPRLPYRVIIGPDGTVRHTGLTPMEPLAQQSERIDALLAEMGAGSSR